MTLTELRYIVAVAQKNHFGKAAQACFVSQPTLSIAIKKLEQDLEVKLFERSSKNEIRVTEIGQQIVDQAKVVLQEAQVLQEISEQGKDPLSGHLYLFCSKNRKRLKILYWDRNGFCLWLKRLEKNLVI